MTQEVCFFLIILFMVFIMLPILSTILISGKWRNEARYRYIPAIGYAIIFLYSVFLVCFGGRVIHPFLAAAIGALVLIGLILAVVTAAIIGWVYSRRKGGDRGNEKSNL